MGGNTLKHAWSRGVSDTRLSGFEMGQMTQEVRYDVESIGERPRNIRNGNCKEMDTPD